MTARIGCLSVLGLWALLGAYVYLWRGETGDGAGAMAVMGLMGMALFLIACAIDGIVAWRQRLSQANETDP